MIIINPMVDPILVSPPQSQRERSSSVNSPLFYSPPRIPTSPLPAPESQAASRLAKILVKKFLQPLKFSYNPATSKDDDGDNVDITELLHYCSSEDFAMVHTLNIYLI
jgi:hypothetical protein